MKKLIEEQLKIVESFVLQQYGVEVHYDVDYSDAFYYDSKRIEINSRQNYISRLHTLLHEAGHVILRCDESDYNSFRAQFPYMIKDNREARGNKNHRADIIREEVLAWEYGKKLAECFSIKIDEDRWNKHRQNALISYMEWF